jgi:hypothetical protein
MPTDLDQEPPEGSSADKAEHGELQSTMWQPTAGELDPSFGSEPGSTGW